MSDDISPATEKKRKFLDYKSGFIFMTICFTVYVLSASNRVDLSGIPLLEKLNSKTAKDLSSSAVTSQWQLSKNKPIVKSSGKHLSAQLRGFAPTTVGWSKFTPYFVHSGFAVGRWGLDGKEAIAETAPPNFPQQRINQRVIIGARKTFAPIKAVLRTQTAAQKQPLGNRMRAPLNRARDHRNVTNVGSLAGRSAASAPRRFDDVVTVANDGTRHLGRGGGAVAKVAGKIANVKNLSVSLNAAAASKAGASSLSVSRATPNAARGIPEVHVEKANCSLIYAGHLRATLDGDAFDEQRNRPPPTGYLAYYHRLNYPTLCRQFKQERGYNTVQPGPLEAQMTFAYVIMAHSHLEQVERLLRAVYQRHHYYVIHVCKKAPATLWDSLRGLSQCIKNVFIVNERYDTHHQATQLLESQLALLLRASLISKWSHLILLQEGDFPLKSGETRAERVQSLNGDNETPVWTSKTTSSAQNALYQTKHNGRTVQRDKMSNINLVPGQLNFILRRNFVQYALHDQVAKQFKAWLRDGAIEKSLIYVFYLSSLNYSPMSGAPGAREPGQANHIWLSYRIERHSGALCRSGLYNRQGTCTLSLRDLSHLQHVPFLFAANFDVITRSLTLSCAEQHYYQLIRAEVLRRQTQPKQSALFSEDDTDQP